MTPELPTQNSPVEKFHSPHLDEGRTFKKAYGICSYKLQLLHPRDSQQILFNIVLGHTNFVPFYLLEKVMTSEYA